jgi:hypothetical protein
MQHVKVVLRIFTFRIHSESVSGYGKFSRNFFEKKIFAKKKSAKFSPPDYNKALVSKDVGGPVANKVLAHNNAVKTGLAKSTLRKEDGGLLKKSE